MRTVADIGLQPLPLSPYLWCGKANHGRAEEMPVEHTVVPVALFLCVTYAFKAAIDAVVRFRMLKEGISETMLQTILQAEQVQRRAGSLRWGIFLVAIGIAFVLIQLFGWTDVGPASVAVVAICAGLSQLVFHFVTRRPE